MSTAGLPGESSIGKARRKVLLVIGIGLAAYVLLEKLAAPSPEAAYWLPLTGWGLASAIVALRSLAAARRATTDNERRAWWYLTAAAAIWCAGIAYESCGSLWLDDFAFESVIARSLYFGYSLFFVAAVYYLSSDGTKSVGPVHLGNLGIIACSMLLCALLVLLQPMIDSAKNAAYIVLTVVDLALLLSAVMMALTYLWSTQTRENRPVVLLLGMAAAIHASVNVAFYYRIHELGGSGTSLDKFWLIAFMLQYWAAFEQGKAPVADAGAISDQGLATRIANAIQIILPAILLLVTFTMMAVFIDQISSTFLPIALPVAIAFALFLGLRDWAIEVHRKRLAKDLWESHALTTQVLRSSPGVIFICEVAPGFPLSYVSENGDRLFGIGKTNFDLDQHIHSDDHAIVSESFQRVLKHGSADAELRVSPNPGEWHWIDLRLAVRHDEHGKAVQIVGTAIDINESKMLKRSLEQNQRLESLGKLSGSIAHDFNNLLTSVLGFSSLLLNSEPLTKEQRSHISEINVAGERGAALTRQLLSFSRRHSFDVEVIDLNELIDEMRGMLERLLGDSADLVFRYSPVPVRVKAGKTQLEQVLMNLVLNAREAMPDGGSIRIMIREVFHDESVTAHDGNPERTAIICIEDEGVGISEQVRAQIFDPFFTTKDEGSGLGLATVHSIVHQHRGSIHVSSSKSGGSRFEVFLPSTPEPGETELPPGANRSDAGTERVLVVDDEVAITRVVASILRPLRYTVYTANNAQQAMEIVGAEPLDMLLCDIVMPGCNGQELTRQLRQVQRHIKVVYMSGYTDDVLTRREIWDQQSPLLQKPLVLSELAAAIRTELDSEQTDPPTARHPATP